MVPSILDLVTSPAPPLDDVHHLPLLESAIPFWGGRKVAQPSGHEGPSPHGGQFPPMAADQLPTPAEQTLIAPPSTTPPHSVTHSHILNSGLAMGICVCSVSMSPVSQTALAMATSAAPEHS